ncbi:SDR family oxidoreductase [Actinomadura parmotrematis]|uniref:SDR family oxidoreductase n=1 Tax=Actinomadura parmotrematis TaxID=2864039 RepID=A0ABS7FQT0_9ACTN|nr:SDR family oxidoreductase [Actinomadura parmotrematis]MBW8482737.1 SDR family oxidoreductase [Actinomadura parmotrematis]
MGVSGQVAVVTGAGSGIGAAVARALLDGGYGVVLAGRREERLRRTAEGFPEERAAVVPADVTDPASVEALFAAAGDRFGRVDLLVNNAGVFGTPAPVEEVGFGEWQRVLQTNLTGAFLCAQRAFAMMRAQSPQGGRIINNGSLSAHVPRPGQVAYTASKHAMSGLTKSLSLEGRAYRIACGQIDVGNAATDMTASFGGGTPQADGSVRAEPVMDVSAVVAGVLYMAGLPLEANVQFMSVLATAMPSFVGRG